jgi:hypothetical protein
MGRKYDGRDLYFLLGYQKAVEDNSYWLNSKTYLTAAWRKEE